MRLGRPPREPLPVDRDARRCAHGFFPDWCVLKSCPHWDRRELESEKPERPGRKPRRRIGEAA